MNIFINIYIYINTYITFQIILYILYESRFRNNIFLFLQFLPSRGMSIYWKHYLMLGRLYTTMYSISDGEYMLCAVCVGFENNYIAYIDQFYALCIYYANALFIHF